MSKDEGIPCPDTQHFLHEPAGPAVLTAGMEGEGETVQRMDILPACRLARCDGERTPWIRPALQVVEDQVVVLVVRLVQVPEGEALEVGLGSRGRLPFSRRAQRVGDQQVALRVRSRLESLPRE